MRFDGTACLKKALHACRKHTCVCACVVWLRLQVGMHPVDLIFSNLRLAPVQVTTYGHSSSTHGSAIDYFVGGEEVEQWVWEGRNLTATQVGFIVGGRLAVWEVRDSVVPCLYRIAPRRAG